VGVAALQDSPRARLVLHLRVKPGKYVGHVTKTWPESQFIWASWLDTRGSSPPCGGVWVLGVSGWLREATVQSPP
jgi:hypothetical protein